MDYQNNQKHQSFLIGQRKKRRTLKKDYQVKKIDNPFFNRRAKREERLSKNLKITMTVFVALLIFIFWFLFYSPLFVVKKIKINGLTRINSTEINNLVFSQISERRAFIFPANNFFAFSTKKIDQQITSKYNFADIKVSKKIPNTIIVDISERPCALIWENTTDSCYFIDPDGYLIKEIGVQPNDRNKLPVIRDERGINVDGNKIGLDRQYLDFMLELYHKINATDLKIDKFVIDKDPNTLRVNLKDGPFLMFSLKDDQDKQLNKLITLRREKLKDSFKNIKYFDLRYGDKVFYVDNNPEAGK